MGFFKRSDPYGTTMEKAQLRPQASSEAWIQDGAAVQHNQNLTHYHVPKLFINKTF